MAEYKIIKMEGRAKRAEFKTVHGTVQTPAASRYSPLRD